MHIQDMLKSHPDRTTHEMSGLSETIEACFDCAQASVTCADACLGEADPAPLARCIRLNGECSEIAQTTGRILSRRVPAHTEIWQAQLRACLIACQMCAKECQSHSAHHQHCRICADACRTCAQACEELLSALAIELRSSP